MSTLFNNTKIIATVGLVSNSKEMLLQLLIAGVDVFRLNFSHGTHKDHESIIKIIRELNDKFGYNVSILQDLQGPKIRIGEIEKGSFELNKDDELIITTKNIKGKKGKVNTNYSAITKDVKSGDTILIDDGKIQVLVKKVDETEVYTTVIYGGTLRSRKGMNLPDTHISESSLTPKDKIDLEFGLKHRVDWIAMSFVRTAGDISLLKNIIQENNKQCNVIAKIERPEAIKNIDSIIEVSDGLMVARGDLGVEILMEEVPIHQKLIVKKCNKAGKPVIIATQMMESMMENPRPTRAEANDVANAVMDGADAVMLSGETAAGKYPVETIQSMERIIRIVEQKVESIYYKQYKLDDQNKNFASNVVVHSACKMAQITNAKAIIGMTFSGFTAFRLARHRPKANIFIFTSSKHLLETLNLVWGIRVFYYNKFESTDATFNDLEDILIKKKHLRKGDIYINTASMPLQSKGKTNVVKVSIVE